MSSSHSSGGKKRCAAWLPCRWPISRGPTLNANSPRRPGPASTPGQEVTSALMRSLAVFASVIAGLLVVVLRGVITLQAQVSLKSRARGDFLSAMAQVLTIGEVSRRSGVAASALRFYEERGLIASERADASHRRFPRTVLRRIAFIVFAQRVGLTLAEIAAELAKLPPDRAPTRRDWARLSSRWTARIDERIAELERLKAGLTECIGCGCPALPRCQLANPDDRARALGPGPRYWIGDRPAGR